MNYLNIKKSLYKIEYQIAANNLKAIKENKNIDLLIKDKYLPTPLIKITSYPSGVITPKKITLENNKYRCFLIISLRKRTRKECLKKKKLL